jgi:hypothetical protein
MILVSLGATLLTFDIQILTPASVSLKGVFYDMKKRYEESGVNSPQAEEPESSQPAWIHKLLTDQQFDTSLFKLNFFLRLVDLLARPQVKSMGKLSFFCII